MFLSNLEKNKGIYKITNKVNGTVYIGKSVNLWSRLGNHLENSSNGKMKKDMEALGLQNFTWEVLQYVEDERDLLELENYWINYYQTRDYVLYNKTAKCSSRVENNCPDFFKLLKEWVVLAKVPYVGTVATVKFKTGFDLCYYLGIDHESFLRNIEKGSYKIWNTELKLTNYQFEYLELP